MEKILAELFGLTFENTPESIKPELKKLKTDYLSLVVNNLSKLSRFFEKIKEDKNLSLKLESGMFLTYVKTQLQMSVTMTETSIKNSIESIGNMALSSFGGEETKSLLSQIIEDSNLSSNTSLLSKRSYDELKNQSPIREEEIKDDVEKKRKIAEGRQKKNKSDIITNSQKLTNLKNKALSKESKLRTTQPKPEQSQKTTTMTMVMNSQIDQTIPESDTSSDEDDKMQISTLKDTLKNGDSGEKKEPEFKKPAPVNPSSFLFSQIPQNDNDDLSDSSSDDEDMGKMKIEKVDEEKKPPLFKKPDFAIPKKKIEMKKPFIEDKKPEFNKFSLMSQLPQNDAVSSSSDDEDIPTKNKPEKKVVMEEEKSEPKKNNTKKDPNKLSNKKSQNPSSKNSGKSPSKLGNIKVDNFKIVSPTSKIDTQYISALVVKNSENLIIAGRWFGIWELEKNDLTEEFECTKNLVKQCKENFT